MKNLSCYLCPYKLQNPHLCPHCSQIFCQNCIKAYLAQKHFCPTCDNYIIDLVDCSRLVNEVEEMFHSKKFKSKVNADENQYQGKNHHRMLPTQKQINRQPSSPLSHLSPPLCPSHNLQLSYLCKNCEKWICSDCGLIESQHRQHIIIPKSQLLKHKKQDLIIQLNKINDNLYKINTKKQKCILDLQVYRAQFKWAKAKVQKYCEELIMKIDGEGEKQMEQFIEKIKEYQDILQQLKKKKYQVQKWVNFDQLCPTQNTKISLNSFPISLLSPCRIQTDPQQLPFLHKPRKIQTLQQIFPAYENFTYEFDYQNFKDDNFHYSDYFELWGQDWRLKIYPNGNSGVNGRYLSVFLQLANAYSVEKSRKYVYRVELLSLNRVGMTIVKEYCSVFQGGESWGYSDFLELGHLAQYLHQGKLLFCVGIRNQSYEGLCMDLKKCILKISNQNNILQKLLCESSHEPNFQKQSMIQISSIQDNDNSVIDQYLSYCKQKQCQCSLKDQIHDHNHNNEDKKQYENDERIKTYTISEQINRKQFQIQINQDKQKGKILKNKGRYRKQHTQISIVNHVDNHISNHIDNYNYNDNEDRLNIRQENIDGMQGCMRDGVKFDRKMYRNVHGIGELDSRQKVRQKIDSQQNIKKQQIKQTKNTIKKQTTAIKQVQNKNKTIALED